MQIRKYAKFHWKYKKLSGKKCGPFFPHSSFSLALPSPSPPSSGQVSQMKMLEMMEQPWLIWVEFNEERLSNQTIQSLNCRCCRTTHWSSKLCKHHVRNGKISWMPLISDLLTSRKANFAPRLPDSLDYFSELSELEYVDRNWVTSSCAIDNHDICGLNILTIWRFDTLLKVLSISEAKQSCGQYLVSVACMLYCFLCLPYNCSFRPFESCAQFDFWYLSPGYSLSSRKNIKTMLLVQRLRLESK